MPRPVAATRRAAACAALAALALTGCTSGPDAETAAAARPAPSTTFTAAEGVPVLVPGRPGEAPSVLAPGESGVRQNPLAFDEAEVTFVTDMVPHHAQALEMASLAPERASDRRVRALAERIVADQGPEIATMQTWLEQNGLPAADEDGGHGGHAMPGMATEADVARLVAARGPAFDRLFLQLMVKHHEGALAMVAEAGTVANVVVADMVADTGAKQAAEIGRMTQLLKTLKA